MESKVSIQFLTVPAGSDIVAKLQDLIEREKFSAAFVIRCVGEINKATIRLAQASPGFDPVKEVSGSWYRINSLVGTLSQGGHLHISLTDNNGHMIGGHVYGPLIASGTVKAVVGECVDLHFDRPFDPRTGFPELSVNPRNTSESIARENYLHQLATPILSDTRGGLMGKAFALRLGPGEDIFDSLCSFATKEKLQSAFILTCVGSVTNATICLADQSTGKKVVKLEGRYEIVALVGTLQANTVNLHISLSDKVGTVLHGDVLAGNLSVFTTAEIIIGEYTDCNMTHGGMEGPQTINKHFLNWINKMELTSN